MTKIREGKNIMEVVQERHKEIGSMLIVEMKHLNATDFKIKTTLTSKADEYLVTTTIKKL